MYHVCNWRFLLGRVLLLTGNVRDEEEAGRLSEGADQRRPLRRNSSECPHHTSVSQAGYFLSISKVNEPPFIRPGIGTVALRRPSESHDSAHGNFHIILCTSRGPHVKAQSVSVAPAVLFFARVVAVINPVTIFFIGKVVVSIYLIGSAFLRRGSGEKALKHEAAAEDYGRS